MRSSGGGTLREGRISRLGGRHRQAIYRRLLLALSENWIGGLASFFLFGAVGVDTCLGRFAHDFVTVADGRPRRATRRAFVYRALRDEYGVLASGLGDGAGLLSLPLVRNYYWLDGDGGDLEARC